MAETSGSRGRRTTDIAIIGILLVLVIALLVWFIAGRRGGDDGVDIDIDLPAPPATTGSVP